MIKPNQMVVTFDIADQSFKLYNATEWKDYIGQLQNELQDELNDCDPDAADLGEAYHWNDEEVIERIHGDELFWEVMDVQSQS